MPPKYSIITTCKGRLRDLKQSLPRFLEQENAEVIVVDYDCPDGTADYVARTHPQARVVAVADQPKFNLPHARNLGVAQARGEFLVFLDADVLIPGDFLKYVDGQMADRPFAIFGPRAKNSFRGQCVVRRAEFAKLGGYDELMDGYGGEDLDFYARLRLLGATPAMLKPEILLEVLEQTREERERFRAPNLKIQFLRGQLYLSAKEMVMRALGKPVLDLALRRNLMKQVDRQLKALYTGEKEFTLEVKLPDKYKERRFLNEWEFSRSVSVKAVRKKQ